jgi:hypothetical protein
VSADPGQEVAAVQGWRPVEDLIRWGFGQSPVVMANEAHSGLTRCVRTREMGVRMIRAAAGILRDQAPRPLNNRTDVDAVVVSTDNALT